MDGDEDFDANDSFLIHLVKLSGTDAQIDQSKGSSALSAAEIRARVNALGGGAATQVFAAGSQVLQPVLSSVPRSDDAVSVPPPSGNLSPLLNSMTTRLFPDVVPDEQPVSAVASGVTQPTSASEFERDVFRQWIDAI